MLTTHELKTFLSAHNNLSTEAIAERITELNNAATRIQSEIKQIAELEARLERDHTRSMNQLQARRVSMQKTCPHEFREFHPDPSGNNDSSSTCTWCGMEL